MATMPPEILVVTQADRDTMLAALRFYQAAQERDAASVCEFEEIATNDGQHPALGPIEIDTLCEKINGGEEYRYAVISPNQMLYEKTFETMSDALNRIRGTELSIWRIVPVLENVNMAEW